MLTRNFEDARRFGAFLQVITDSYDHWKMDESPSATTAVNDGSHDYDFTNIEGNTDFTTSGLINNGIEFTGTNGDRCWEGADWSLGANSFSFGCFCKADDFGVADGRMMSQTQGVATNNHDWMLSTNTTARARARMRVDGTVEEIQSDNNVLVAGTWHHIVVTYDAVAGDLKLYVDKSVVASDLTLSGNFGNTAARDVGIGNTPGSTTNRAFDGIIDDVRTYDRALPQADVNLWYEVGFPPAPPSDFIPRVTLF